MDDCLQAIEEIMSHISARWQFPVAVYFAALIGAETSSNDQGSPDDDVLFAKFHSGAFGCKYASILSLKEPRLLIK